jgi:hypothetical protein
MVRWTAPHLAQLIWIQPDHICWSHVPPALARLPLHHARSPLLGA